MADDAEIAVPFGAAPDIDGTISPGEWDDAVRLDTGEGAAVYLKHDGKNLYVAFRGKGKGIATVYFYADGEVRVLHASYSLGTSAYKKLADGEEYTAVREFRWVRDAEAFRRDESWHASMILEGAPTDIEFSISLDLLGIETLADATPPIALAYIHLTEGKDSGKPDLFRLPPRLSDSTLSEKLLCGYNPEELYFDPESWGQIRLGEGER